MKYETIKIILIRIVVIAGFLVFSFALMLVWALITVVTMDRKHACGKMERCGRFGAMQTPRHELDRSRHPGRRTPRR